VVFYMYIFRDSVPHFVYFPSCYLPMVHACCTISLFQLSKAALLVLLKTKIYGQEPKHEIELDALSSSFTGPKDRALATLVVDLTTRSAQKDGSPLLDRLLKDRGCTLDPDQVSFQRKRNSFATISDPCRKTKSLSY